MHCISSSPVVGESHYFRWTFCIPSWASSPTHPLIQELIRCPTVSDLPVPPDPHRKLHIVLSLPPPLCQYRVPVFCYILNTPEYNCARCLHPHAEVGLLSPLFSPSFVKSHLASLYQPSPLHRLLFPRNLIFLTNALPCPLELLLYFPPSSMAPPLRKHGDRQIHLAGIAQPPHGWRLGRQASPFRSPFSRPWRVEIFRTIRPFICVRRSPITPPRTHPLFHVMSDTSALHVLYRYIPLWIQFFLSPEVEIKFDRVFLTLPWLSR